MTQTATLLVWVLCLLAGTLGHITITYPCPRYNPNGKECPSLPEGQELDYSLRSPISSAGQADSLPFCHHETPWPSAAASFSAGDTIDVTFEPDGAAHGGGHCQFSLSYDGGKTFVVIHEVLKHCFFSGPSSSNTPEVTSYKVKLPDDIPGSDSVMFVWSWVNAIGNREFYMNCADVSISGSSTSYTGKEMTIANYGDYPTIPEFNGNYDMGIENYNNAKQITVNGDGTSSGGQKQPGAGGAKNGQQQPAEGGANDGQQQPVQGGNTGQPQQQPAEPRTVTEMKTITEEGDVFTDKVTETYTNQLQEQATSQYITTMATTTTNIITVTETITATQQSIVTETNYVTESAMLTESMSMTELLTTTQLSLSECPTVDTCQRSTNVNAITAMVTVTQDDVTEISKTVVTITPSYIPNTEQIGPYQATVTVQGSGDKVTDTVVTTQTTTVQGSSTAIPSTIMSTVQQTVMASYVSSSSSSSFDSIVNGQLS